MSWKKRMQFLFPRSPSVDEVIAATTDHKATSLPKYEQATLQTVKTRKSVDRLPTLMAENLTALE